MNSLKNKLIIAEGDIGLMQDFEKFEKEHPEARIEFATHGTTYRPKEYTTPEKNNALLHYLVS